MKFLSSGYSLLSFSILLTVYAQLAMKKHMTGLEIPNKVGAKLLFLVSQLMQPLALSSIVAAFLAGLIWMAVISKHDLSHLYPLFICSTIVAVVILSTFLFNESLSFFNMIGLCLIIIGLIVSTLGR